MKTKLFLIVASSSILAGSGMGFAQTEPKWDIKWTDHTANPVDVKPKLSDSFPQALILGSKSSLYKFRLWNV